MSRHVREAIRKDKLEREYKQHQVNILGEVREMTRNSTRQKSIQNRFLVKSNYRALKLDSLDVAAQTNTPANTPAILSPSQGLICKLCSQMARNKCQCNVAHVDSDTVSDSSSDTISDSSKQKCDKSANINTNVTDSTKKEVNEQILEKKEEKIFSKVVDDQCKFCLVDVEVDPDSVLQSVIKSCSSSQISCNSLPMEREALKLDSNHVDYVYDLYYTNNRDFDFRLFENNLMLEAYGDEIMLGRGACEDDYVEEDDEDDENAENNWRNDYPEEDPGFINNQDVEYEYGEGLDDITAFGVSDELTEWMKWKCHMKDGDLLSSDDDAVELYETAGSSYEAYYERIHHEMAEENGSEKIEEEERI